MDDDDLREKMTEPDRTHLITAHGQLRQAATLAELACESLSPVAGLVENWERIRELVLAIRDERDRLEDHL